MDDLFATHAACPGYRLHKLEVYNWGTFDSTGGQVFAVRPAGQTTLLIGQNGSGKSTLVDALLTLLVRPVVRNYNVAAGAGKQERDERTYIKGAYGRFSRDEDRGADVQYLRPKGGHYSALLACFRNEGTGEAFTLALVLYLTPDGKSEKVYCFSKGERSIAADCAGLPSVEKVRQQMEKRGFQATTTYSEYHSWFVKATRVKPKAMDMFNQTVAVKDIQSLNKFIREHMLEAGDWSQKIDNLLDHFKQLSEAHRSLVQVRRQSDLLEPISARGAAYRTQDQQLQQVRRLLEAADSFFRSKTVELLTPECEGRRAELAAAQTRMDQLAVEIAEAQEECRRLKNEIELAGGERLRQIPLLIRQHELQRESKRAASLRYHEALRGAGLATDVTDADAFAAVQAQLAPLVAHFEQQLGEHERVREASIIERGHVNRTLDEDEQELQALERRQGNFPEALSELRRRLCDDLRLSEKELPFAAELIAVKPEERAWEASLELVLRNFALSLLVPQRHYHVVSRYAEETKLSDGRGRGQRLVYLRVGERSETSGPMLQPQSLLRKLHYREGHSLLPWVKAELAQRFDYRCCEDIAEFQSSQGLALTLQRHVKLHGVRHEKDDRDRVSDPRNFVLGWDNHEKRRRLAAEVLHLRNERERLDAEVVRLAAEAQRLRERQAAVREAQRIALFSDIDHAVHQRDIQALHLEREALEQQSDALRTLKQRLSSVTAHQTALTASRDGEVGIAAGLKKAIADGEQLITTARRKLQEAVAADVLAVHQQAFVDLEACFADSPLTAALLFEQELTFLKTRRAEADHLHRELEPLRNELCAAMSRFLNEFPAERADLDASPASLDSFLGVQERILHEDLPRHELRFKERLNEKVIADFGLLNGALQTQRTEIERKIEQLNRSLGQLEYRPGTYMRLEPKPAHDREITDFREALKECLAGTFEGTLAADEARYLRVEKLIERLRDESRWRDKVLDVRRWFDFAARELDAATGAERGYYEDSTGQSGGEKAKLAFTILVAAIAYQYDLDPQHPTGDRFHFVVVDEMFSKVDDQYSVYALELFQKFGLQLLIVAPLDAKARVTEPYVGCYLHVVKDAATNHSEIFCMTAREFEEAVAAA